MMLGGPTQWAMFSRDRGYRYKLGMRLTHHGGRRIAWIMLNPSIADHQRSDPTLRRCASFSKRWGFDELSVGNLFALVSPYPERLKTAEDPVGPENGWWLSEICEKAEVVVAAWGAHPMARARGKSLASAVAKDLWCLGTTADGSPRHPLYVKRDTPLERWRSQESP